MRLLVGVTITAVALLLSACQAGAPAAAPRPTPTVSQSASEPSRSPDEPDSIVLTLVGFDFRIDGDEGTVPFEAEPMTDFLTQITGAAPAVEDLNDWWGGGTIVAHRYSWDGVSFVVFDNSTWAPPEIASSSLGGVPVSTRNGIAVGTSREQVEALDPREVWDEDGDGSFDHLGLEARDAPNTESLTRPGEPGEDFILVVISDGVVSGLGIGDDYSDL